MTETPFESRLRAAGLRLRPEDMPKLETLVKDLDRAGAGRRGARGGTGGPPGGGRGSTRWNR